MSQLASTETGMPSRWKSRLRVPNMMHLLEARRLTDRQPSRTPAGMPVRAEPRVDPIDGLGVGPPLGGRPYHIGTQHEVLGASRGMQTPRSPLSVVDPCPR